MKQCITALLLAPLAALHATPAHDPQIHVRADHVLHPVPRYLTGACIEDVNHEIYGGLYSQMIFGESFQEPNNCHFRPAANVILGKMVSDAILATMEAGSAAAGSSKPAGSQQPNVVLVVCDDLGLGDLACYGNPIVKTPKIDQLAAQGGRLEQYYCPAPICGPSRVALMTGRYYERSGFRMAHDSRNSSLQEPWLAGQLRAGGYATGAFGKWHIGEKGFGARGFEEWTITSPGGWADYYKYSVYKNSETHRKSDGTYATDYITDEAIGFIERTAKAADRKPFFAYVAYTAPHFPLQAPEEEIAPYRGKGLLPGTEIVYGMIARMDKGIGRILATLKKSDVIENTLFIFTSDNGPELGPYKGLEQRRFNCELAGQKEYVLEGGIRVPCIVSWPKRFGKQGKVFHVPMQGVDWAPTILAAAGIEPKGKPFDGISFLGALEEKSAAPGAPRFWCYNKAYFTSTSNAAMREGDWKLHRPSIAELNRWDNSGKVPGNLKPQPWQLFNIANDPQEKINCADKEPERLQRMIKKFDAWWEEVAKENYQQNGESFGPEIVGSPAGNHP